MTTLEILRAARALIAQPGRWCQDTGARDNRGSEVSATSKRACQWCSYGAVNAIAGGDGEAYDRCAIELSKTASRLFGKRPAIVNDTTDLPTVLAMFDATIARQESQNG